MSINTDDNKMMNCSKMLIFQALKWSWNFYKLTMLNLNIEINSDLILCLLCFTELFYSRW